MLKRYYFSLIFSHVLELPPLTSVMKLFDQSSLLEPHVLRS